MMSINWSKVNDTSAAGCGETDDVVKLASGRVAVETDVAIVSTVDATETCWVPGLFAAELFLVYWRLERRVGPVRLVLVLGMT